MTETADLVLTSPLDRWEATLEGGAVVIVWAHGVKEDAERYVFVALMRGEPNYESEVCSIPMSAVVDLVGG
jgi:hypothetical protein